jgi:hypothetical protein
VVASFSLFALALARAQPPPFDRYVSPILPGVVLLAAVGAVQMVRSGWALRAVALIAVVVVTASGMDALPHMVTKYRNAQFTLLHSNTASLRPYITDHRGVIGVRASKLNGIDPKIVTWGTQFLTEAEWKTFLLWPSDVAVLRMLEKHNIGWVAILSVYNLEIAYNNAWTRQVYGASVKTWTRLFESGNFCERFHYGYAALFEVGPCPPGDPGVKDPVLSIKPGDRT